LVFWSSPLLCEILRAIYISEYSIKLIVKKSNFHWLNTNWEFVKTIDQTPDLSFIEEDLPPALKRVTTDGGESRVFKWCCLHSYKIEIKKNGKTYFIKRSQWLHNNDNRYDKAFIFISKLLHLKRKLMNNMLLIW